MEVRRGLLRLLGFTCCLGMLVGHAHRQNKDKQIICGTWFEYLCRPHNYALLWSAALLEDTSCRVMYAYVHPLDPHAHRVLEVDRQMPAPAIPLRVIRPQAEDVTHLTQQLQLLHVTKEFQQLVKASSTAPGSAGAVSTAAAAAAAAGGGGGAAGGSNGAGQANKEAASLENLMKVGGNCSWLQPVQ